MNISAGPNNYCCFEEYSGIKFSKKSEKELGIQNDTMFASFDQCKEIVAKHHNMDVSTLEIGQGAVRT